MKKLLLFTKLPALLLTGIVFIFTNSISAQTDTTWHSSGIDTISTNNHAIAKEGMTVKKQLTTDTLKVARIEPVDGDSIIAIGRHSIYFNATNNNIAWATGTGQNGGFSIGNGDSTALCLALGMNSLAFGFTAKTEYSAASSVAIGYFARTIGNKSYALGNQAQSFGQNSMAFGTSTALGDYSTVLGYSSDALGNYSTALGNWATASGDSSIAIGNQTTTGGKYSTAMGYTADADGRYSMAIGNYAFSYGNHSMTFGNSLVASADTAFVIGSGVSSTSQLIILLTP